MSKFHRRDGLTSSMQALDVEVVRQTHSILHLRTQLLHGGLGPSHAALSIVLVVGNRRPQCTDFTSERRFVRLDCRRLTGHGAFRGIKQRDNSRNLEANVMQPCLRHQQSGPVRHISRQESKPTLNLPPVLTIQRGMHMVLDQRCCSKDVSCLNSMRNRFVEQTMRSEPGAGAGMQLSDLCAGIGLPQPVAQQVPEGFVVAKPDPLVVRRH